MKKIFIMFVAVACLLCSCQPNHSTPESITSPSEQNILTAATEALAMAEIVTLLSGSAPFCLTNPFCFMGILITSGAISAADSYYNGRLANSKYSVGKVSNINLPAEFILKNNPFELFGITHNNGLDRMNKGEKNANIISGLRVHDYDSWHKLIYYLKPDCTETEANDYYNTSKKISSSSIFSKYLLPELKNIDRLLSLIQSSNISDVGKTRISKFLKDILYNSYSNELLLNINSQILLLLNESNENTASERFELVFLTTLKHSIFYWSN